MFGTSGELGDGQVLGTQIMGFGYLHDGSIATLLVFFASPTFQFPAPQRDNQADVVRFVMAADSNMAPIVGQQVTLHANSPEAVLSRLDLLEQRASITAPRPECDLVARGLIDQLRYSSLLQADGDYLDTDGARRESASLRSMARAAGNSVTFTCLPPGTGERLALDR